MKLFFLMLCFLIIPNTYAGFTNESDAGLAAANGNTKTQTYNFKQLNVYDLEKNIFTLRSRYLNAFANSNETARYFNLGLRYDRDLGNNFSLFIGETLERDKFAGIDRRLITDTGAKYFIVKTDMTKWFSEAGYRYMVEERLTGSKAITSYIRGYTEWETKWNQSFSSKYWLEYLPNLTVNSDYQINTEASISSMLTNIFSLKSAFLLRYDHLPAPGIAHQTDTLLTTSLVAKF